MTILEIGPAGVFAPGLLLGPSRLGVPDATIETIFFLLALG